MAAGLAQVPVGRGGEGRGVELIEEKWGRGKDGKRESERDLKAHPAMIKAASP